MRKLLWMLLLMVSIPAYAVPVSITGEWDAVVDEGATYNMFMVGSPLPLNAAPITTTVYTHNTDLEPGTYEFFVRSVVGERNSSNSNHASGDVLVPLLPPTNFRVIIITVN